MKVIGEYWPNMVVEFSRDMSRPNKDQTWADLRALARNCWNQLGVVYYFITYSVADGGAVDEVSLLDPVAVYLRVAVRNGDYIPTSYQYQVKAPEDWLLGRMIDLPEDRIIHCVRRDVDPPV